VSHSHINSKTDSHTDSHINDEHLDQYAIGTLPTECLAGVEEHLLVCEACQARLLASDEFAMLFRATAVQPDARAQRGWRVFWNYRGTSWAVATAVFALLIVLGGTLRKSPMAPATVMMHSLRGPDAPAEVAAGQPAWLVFDIVPAGAVKEYKALVVNTVGVEMLAAKVSLNNGRLAVLVNRLPAGSYWVRVFRDDHTEPIAEYGLLAK
jgi:hypothetical protein